MSYPKTTAGCRPVRPSLSVIASFLLLGQAATWAAPHGGELELLRLEARVGRVLDLEAPQAAVVFCRTRDQVDQLTETLNGRGYRAEALHGGMDQEQRDRVMGRLRDGPAELLIATDVAARGLDLDDITHVINFDPPEEHTAYVHRVGRTGRAGRNGTGVTLVLPEQQAEVFASAGNFPSTTGGIELVADAVRPPRDLGHPEGCDLAEIREELDSGFAGRQSISKLHEDDK